MRKMISVFVLMVFISIGASAQVLSEDFNYSGALTSNGWSGHSGTGTNAISTTTGLTYTGYEGSGVGNAALVQNLGGEDINIGFTEFNGDGLTVFVSMLVNVNEAASTKAGDYFFNLGDRVSAASFTSFCARVGVKVTSDVVNFGISNTSTITYGATAFSKNTTYLLIIKYTISSAGNDPVSLWVLPSGVPADEAAAGTAEVINTTTAGTATNIVDAVALRQGSATNSVSVIVDGIRIGSTWNTAPLPVELVSFNAAVKGRGVELAWKTATETNNHGFEVEKNVAGSWNKIGFVEGHGTTNAPQSYSFVDASAKGTVAYRLKQIDRDGKFEYSKTVEATVAGAITEFGLTQNYPNPFNPATRISYMMPSAGQVSLKVYDMLGKEVASLVNGIRPAGENVAEFNASQLPSGLYFYTMRTGSFSATKKMLLVK